ncbi:unnamed protein product [Durusdinium trenchii]|uniref:MGAT4 conserved region domain-containing protein n=1 Tax=Durusdinium trenchii TaxID=1381693 RepID=A0ABP0QD49_9DINO
MHRGRALNLQLPCALAAVCLVFLNEVILAALPLVQRAEPDSFLDDILLQPALTADDRPGCMENGLAVQEASASWRDLDNPLKRLAPDSLRILPAGEEGKRMSRTRRWMTFGMSSIKRPKASYLGITLSRMFNVLDLELAETAIVVHLADFDEDWVLATAKWLRASFSAEASKGRLQAIHAPRNLYALKQAELNALDLGGFCDFTINGKYMRRKDEVGGHMTYWSKNGKWILYWCSQRAQTAIVHRRWAVGKVEDWDSIQSGTCVAVARAPEDMEVLDPIIKGWEEFLGRWELAPKAGISNLDLSEGELLKFGDSPKRQWWRTKQNLDYTFLMWYAANISDYYMQMEDDIQPVPHFILTVRSYIQRSLLGKHWVMASFSSLGFIGKLFNNSHVPKLAEFLLTFSTEAPCDWLVWVWIDAMSPWPVAPDIPKDVEQETQKREKAIKDGPEAVKKLGFMRDDLQAYYLNSSWPQLFQTPAVEVDTTKAWPDQNGAVESRFPQARVESNMKAHKAFTANLVYPPGDPLGFWTSDTCTFPSGKADPLCEHQKKYFRLVFNEPLHGEVKVIIRQSRAQHENDFIKSGSLQVSRTQDCNKLQRVKELQQAEEIWKGHMDRVLCLQVTLDKPQPEWIAIREIVIEPQSSTSTKPNFLSPKVHSSEVSHSFHYALQHAFEAAALGFLAGSLAWVAIWEFGKRYEIMRSVGCFAPWTFTFIMVLDVSLLIFLKPDRPTVPSSDPSPTPSPLLCQNQRPREKLPLDWRVLRPGISFLEKSQLKHLGPARDPRETSEAWEKRQVSIGVIAQPDMDAAFVASSVLQIVQHGAGDATIALLVGQARNSPWSPRRQEFVQKLRELLHQGGDLLHLLDPSADLYPEAPTKTENVDLALLTAFLEPLSDAFMMVELDCGLVKDYPYHLRRFTQTLDSLSTPWIVVEFTGPGHTRKLLRSRLLPRFREMLVMFPNVPAASLFWDFIDVVGNETAPKSIYLGTDAGKRDRPDVKLQHNKHQALIEHLGDVSSLEGKVQRAQEAYFKNNVLVESLFDNPPGMLKTNIPGSRQDILQAVYDGSKTAGEVTCGGHSAKSCSECPQGHGASWCNRDCGWVDGTCKTLYKTDKVTTSQDVYFELVFEDAQDVEIVSLSMGGTVKPPCSNCKDKPDESPDDDFAHALDDAELLFARGQKDLMGEVGCEKYFKVRNIAGREVFWKSNSSRFVTAVKCVRISIPRAQEHALILRAFQIRSSKAGYNNVASLAAAGFNLPSTLESKWLQCGRSITWSGFS